MKKHILIDNIQIPLLGFGTWNIKGKECVNSVEDALSLGYRHIDTARMYGNEKEVGEGIKKSKVDRSDIYLVTKIATSELEPKLITRITEDSLRNLQTDYIDLLLIHWPVPGMDLKGILEEMNKMQEQSKVKQLGVSNFSPDLVKEALTTKRIVNNQVEFNPHHLQHDNLKMVKENNMFLTAYTPIDKGKVFKNSVINEIAEKYSKNEAQVTLRWLLQHNNVAVIPKAATREHRESNMDIFDFELTQEDMIKIAST